MKKCILFYLILSCTSPILQAQSPAKITLLNEENSQAIYKAIQDFIQTNKIEEMPNFIITIRNDQQTIRVDFSEALNNLDDNLLGGGKIFTYTISKENSEIIDVKNLLQR